VARVGRSAIADDLAQRLRAAGAGMGSVSRTSTPAPSPITNPSRPRSNGREAAAGSSLRVESARIAAKPATSGSEMTASADPASITSASPRRMISHASPTAWPPLAQADAIA